MLWLKFKIIKVCVCSLFHLKTGIEKLVLIIIVKVGSKHYLLLLGMLTFYHKLHHFVQFLKLY